MHPATYGTMTSTCNLHLAAAMVMQGPACWTNICCCRSEEENLLYVHVQSGRNGLLLWALQMQPVHAFGAVGLCGIYGIITA